MDSIRYETPDGKVWITTDDQGVLSISHNRETRHYEIRYGDRIEGRPQPVKMVSIPESRVYEASLQSSDVEVPTNKMLDRHGGDNG
jgi:hypothetical protein